MVVARPAVTVVARAKDSAVTTEGYCGDGSGGNEDDSKSNSGKNGERSGNSRGGASHLSYQISPELSHRRTWYKFNLREHPYA